MATLLQTFISNLAVPGLVCTFNWTNLWYVFTAAVPFNLQEGSPGTLGVILGLDNTGAPWVAKPDGANYTYISSRAANFTLPTLFYICVDGFRNPNIVSEYAATFIVPVNTGRTNPNIYTSTTEFPNIYWFAGSEMQLNELKITILDQNGRIYNNNNSDNLFIFMFG